MPCNLTVQQTLYPSHPAVDLPNPILPVLFHQQISKILLAPTSFTSPHLQIHTASPPCALFPTALMCSPAKAQPVFRMPLPTSHPSPQAFSSPLLHTSVTALVPQPCQLPALEKHQGFKNLGRGCNCESFPGLHFEGSKCGKERQLCLHSQTGKTPWCCSPSMQGTSFTGEEHKVGASCKRVQYLRLDRPTIRKQVIYQTDNKNNKV